MVIPHPKANQNGQKHRYAINTPRLKKVDHGSRYRKLRISYIYHLPDARSRHRCRWDQLMELEKQCSQHVAIMKTQDMGIPPDESIRLRKVELIRKILADDAEIRNQTEPWVEQLQRIMQSTGQERRLQQTYSSEY